VNNGKFVALTTHSDYLISEFSNLIALSNVSKDVRKKLSYRDAEVLEPEAVAAGSSGSCSAESTELRYSLYRPRHTWTPGTWTLMEAQHLLLHGPLRLGRGELADGGERGKVPWT
jgi:hypothetical protein